jgi:hypothetical protein
MHEASRFSRTREQFSPPLGVDAAITQAVDAHGVQQPHRVAVVHGHGKHSSRRVVREGDGRSAAAAA